MSTAAFARSSEKPVFAETEARIVTALAGTEVSYEYAVTDTDGTRRFARSTLLPDITPQGKVIGCFAHAVDITEQRRTYNALAQAQKMELIGQLTGGSRTTSTTC